ncbi:hypothetical protein CHISP_2820 [Chitinispirillum alkaliphilum]|nr:hypothetical protein CHISP_2820 [Chitinispirillum alkaliphilum]
MRSILVLFSEIKSAKESVDSLLQRGFSLKEMNCIVLDSIARLNLDINREELKAEISPFLGKDVIGGIERLFTGKRPINTADAGKILTAGETATIVGTTAEPQNPGKVNSLKRALVDFGVTAETAQLYTDKVTRGEVLFWIKTLESRAPEAVNILRDHQGKHIITIP